MSSHLAFRGGYSHFRILRSGGTCGNWGSEIQKKKIASASSRKYFGLWPRSLIIFIIIHKTVVSNLTSLEAGEKTTTTRKCYISTQGCQKTVVKDWVAFVTMREVERGKGRCVSYCPDKYSQIDMSSYIKNAKESATHDYIQREP